ncbi:hypothetical protein DCAR_0726832 [Daucus carota subsp. sativus]|uniref:ADP-ribosyl cyclase/cyclic ADP-ribose hydrolase n=1 Tax=Daucus carota subsp. sativus TaxID=79200 RepID=A0AAF1B858_DAUCS|nr:hypothetical protein DCAR_0726832 [Daucus carota subsp. sativus]
MHNKWSIYPSSLDTTSQWNVFLSFRGVDTRKTFVSHLNAEMKHAGIKVFLDDDALRRGYKIKSGLFEAIEESKILIIVFSKNYAFSKWCLDELVKILERQNTQEPWRQLVFPIFYNVDPRDVEKQEGSFKIAFEVNNRRYPKETVDIWRAALSEAGTLGGWDLQNSWDGYFFLTISSCYTS